MINSFIVNAQPKADSPFKNASFRIGTDEKLNLNK